MNQAYRGQLHGSAKEFHSRKVVLKAGGAKSVGLGTYTQIRSKSDFTFSITPDIGDDLGVSLEMVDIPGTEKVLGLCHLHNYGDKGCEVTISNRIIGKNR
jgi:hypothetical protein